MSTVSRAAARALAIAHLLSSTLSGCSLYHDRLFARQDSEPALQEIYLSAAPADPVQVLAVGELAGVQKKHGGAGTASLIESGGERYLRLTSWATLEAPDLYFYLSLDGADAVAANPKALLQGSDRSVRLNANNLRPSNLGFSGEELWFRVPKGFEAARSLNLYCYRFDELFATAPLE